MIENIFNLVDVLNRVGGNKVDTFADDVLNSAYFQKVLLFTAEKKIANPAYYCVFSSRERRALIVVGR